MLRSVVEINETGKAVHEPTTLLPPPSYGGWVNPCRELATVSTRLLRAFEVKLCL